MTPKLAAISHADILNYSFLTQMVFFKIWHLWHCSATKQIMLGVFQSNNWQLCQNTDHVVGSLGSREQCLAEIGSTQILIGWRHAGKIQMQTRPRDLHFSTLQHHYIDNISAQPGKTIPPSLSRKLANSEFVLCLCCSITQQFFLEFTNFHSKILNTKYQKF